ncbi:MAG TPA: S8 family serine peptidase, partial [Pyrinomonadaceae bacterium]
VVVAAAGNNGKDGNDSKLYGRIHCPGNEPSAITTGASNSFGTTGRDDDTVTTYSSRGPTRSSWTDESGVKHYDNLMKPDLVAPGNRVIWAEARNNHIVTTHPELDAGVSSFSSRKMMYLSGTSMSTPVAAGAAVLLLQLKPGLTPNMVKMILMYTAQPLAGFNQLEQGAGELNIEGAVRLAKLLRDPAPTAQTGDPLLSGGALPVPATTIAGQTFNWSQGLILNHAAATGTEFISSFQKIYATGMVLGDGILEDDASQSVNPQLMTSGVVLNSDILTSDGTTLTGGTPFLSNSMLLSDGIIIGDGIVIGDGIIVGDGIVIGDGIIVGDARLQAQSAMVNGD